MKITGNCFAVLGLGYYPPWTVNSGFITGRETTLIIDSGPNYLSAQTIFGYSTTAAPGNRLKLVNTEKHLDHIGGNCFFAQKGIEICGHKEIARNNSDLSDEKKDFNRAILSSVRRDAHEEAIFYENTTIVNPSIALKDGSIFELGEGVEAMVLFTPGHTPTNISIFIPEDGVVYCGDLLLNRYLPNLNAGEKEDWKLWLISLDKIMSLHPEFIVPGHGDVINGSAIISEIERVRRVLEKAIDENKSPTAEIKKIQ
jgi:glyoxylase-like metal-dependent hydrolase (beta-lactamase superfamily II)